LPLRIVRYGERGKLDRDYTAAYLEAVDNRSLLKRPLPYRQYNAAFFLIGINVLVFLFQRAAPQSMRFLAMNPVFVLEGNYWWQPFTYMFAHAGASHLFFNMLGLFFFGTQVERRWGSNEFLLYYLLTGFLAGVFSLVFYVLTGNMMVFLLGASGAVFAVLLAFATLFPTAIIYLFGIIPIRAPILVLGYTAIELFSQMRGAPSGVAHLTHLAGFLFGFLYFTLRLETNPIRVFLDELR